MSIVAPDRSTAYCYDCGWVWAECCCHMYPDAVNIPEPVAPGRDPAHDEYISDNN